MKRPNKEARLSSKYESVRVSLDRLESNERSSNYVKPKADFEALKEKVANLDRSLNSFKNMGNITKSYDRLPPKSVSLSEFILVLLWQQDNETD